LVVYSYIQPKETDVVCGWQVNILTKFTEANHARLASQARLAGQAQPHVWRTQTILEVHMLMGSGKGKTKGKVMSLAGNAGCRI
jgi:hypothetical protein